jgi:uncharacterized membrane protein
MEENNCVVNEVSCVVLSGIILYSLHNLKTNMNMSVLYLFLLDMNDFFYDKTWHSYKKIYEMKHPIGLRETMQAMEATSNEL